MRRLWYFLCEIFPEWIVPILMGILGSFIGMIIARLLGLL